MTHTTKYEKKDGKTNKVKSVKNGTSSEASSGAAETNPVANKPGKKEGEK